MTAMTRPLPRHLAAAIPRGPSRAVSPARKRLALGVAVIADVVQWVFFPVTVEGALSPVEIAIDVATAFIVLLVVGFQWRLAFAFAAELVPGVDMFPTWTAVVASLPTSDPRGNRLPKANG